MKFSIAESLRRHTDRSREQLRTRKTPAPANVLLTTGDAARLLDLTLNGVRWLEREGLLECERTLSGRRLFRKGDVMALAIKRVEARHPLLAEVKPRMAKARLKAGQLSLPLPLERQKAKHALHQGEVKVLNWRGKKNRVA